MPTKRERAEFERLKALFEPPPPAEDDDELDDDEEDDEEGHGGVLVFHGRKADAFLDRFFGSDEPKTKRRKTSKPEPDDEPDDEDEPDEPDEDPEPDRGHRYFQGRRR